MFAQATIEVAVRAVVAMLWKYPNQGEPGGAVAVGRVARQLVRADGLDDHLTAAVVVVGDPPAVVWRRVGVRPIERRRAQRRETQEAVRGLPTAADHMGAGRAVDAQRAHVAV